MDSPDVARSARGHFQRFQSSNDTAFQKPLAIPGGTIDARVSVWTEKGGQDRGKQLPRSDEALFNWSKQPRLNYRCWAVTLAALPLAEASMMPLRTAIGREHD